MAYGRLRERAASARETAGNVASRARQDLRRAERGAARVGERADRLAAGAAQRHRQATEETRERFRNARFETGEYLEETEARLGGGLLGPPPETREDRGREPVSGFESPGPMDDADGRGQGGDLGFAFGLAPPAGEDDGGQGQGPTVPGLF